MNEELATLWDSLEPYVPADILPAFHQTGNWLRTFRKSDEILMIFQATGVLGVILGELPNALAKERALLNAFGHDLGTLLKHARDSRLKDDSNNLASLKEVQNRIRLHVDDIGLVGSEIRQVLRSAADIDLDKLATALHAKLEETILDPAERIAASAVAVIEGVNQHLPEMEAFLAKARKRNWWEGWGKQFAIGYAFLATLIVLGVAQMAWQHRSFNVAVREAQDRELFDEETLGALALTGRQIQIQPEGSKERLILPRAEKVWISPDGEGVIEFEAKP